MQKLAKKHIIPKKISFITYNYCKPQKKIADCNLQPKNVFKICIFPKMDVSVIRLAKKGADLKNVI